MYSRINVKNIVEGHKASFYGKSETVSFQDNCAYKYLPFLISIGFIFVKVPDDGVKNIFGICLSILIGLFLNILVLLTTNISSEKLKLSSTQKGLRLALLKETFYNVSYSVIVCIKALIVLFLMGIIVSKNETLNDLFYILINNDFNFFIQFSFGIFLYYYTINVFLILFMILKRINKLFISEIEIENFKIKDLIKKEEKMSQN